MAKKTIIIIAVIAAVVVAGAAVTLGVVLGGKQSGEADKTSVDSVSVIDSGEEDVSDQSEEEGASQGPEKLDFSGVTMSGDTLTYDGQSHTLTVAGAPDFATVTYTDNGPFVNAGSYEIKAKVSADGYNDLLLKATLVINKADLTGVTFESQSYEYDGRPHSISVMGNIPSTATVAYSSDVEGVTNSATEVGNYNVTAVVSDTNFNSLSLNAKLSITVSDSERYLFASGDTLYFQNARDDDKLYYYNFNDKEVVKVGNVVSQYISDNGDGSVVYVSKSLFLSSINTATYDTESHTVKDETLLAKNASYVIRGEGKVVYFVVNALTNDSSGIYKVDFSGEEAVSTLLSAGKAKYLTKYGDKLYFADGANGDKLSSISINGENQTRTLVYDEKIKTLTCYGGVLYFTANKPLDSYIARYTISTGVVRKLTCDAGIDLVIVGDYLYYVNVDLLTTAIYGDGIYKVDKDPLADSSSKGIKVIDGGENGVCSLTAYGNDLIYYDVDGYKLIRYSTLNQTKVDLLDGFVKPEPGAPLSLGSQVTENDGIIYYLDLYDGKRLHSYNPKTGANLTLTSTKTDSFAFVGDYIYLNTVSYLVNNDVYRINYKTATLPEKVNDFDAKDIVSDGTYIYYIERNAIGVATALHKANADGSGDIIIFDKGVDNLVMYGGTLYFCKKATSIQYVYKIENAAAVNASVEPVLVMGTDHACDAFTIADGVIYFRENLKNILGVLNGQHQLAKINIDGQTGYSVLAKTKTDPKDMYVSGGYVYYANSAETASDFDLYRVSVNGSDSTKKKLTDGMYASAVCEYDGYVYFINYYLGGTQGDSHLYRVPVTGGEPEKIA